LAKIVALSIEQSKQESYANSSSVAEKLESIQSIRWSRSSESADLLFRRMDLREPVEVQLAALDGIASYADEAVINKLIVKYSSLSPSTRSKAADLLLSKKQWLEILLSRAGEGGFDLRDLDASRQNALQQHADLSIREKANSLLGRSTNSNRDEVLAKYRESLTLRGSQESGKQHFAKSCAACHRLDGVGYELGPNLATFKYRGAEAILQNVIDPNREVNPQYVSYTVLTTDERTITGMIESETATHLTLVRGDNARDTIPRSEIEQLKSSRVSIMPEGLENQLNPQAMADLLAYLLNTP
jgi:putative heme-binding domain-containing protein